MGTIQWKCLGMASSDFNLTEAEMAAREALSRRAKAISEGQCKLYKKPKKKLHWPHRNPKPATINFDKVENGKEAGKTYDRRMEKAFHERWHPKRKEYEQRSPVKTIRNGKKSGFTNYEEYIQSPQWLSKRLKVYETYGRFCTACHSTKELHIHHLTYARIFKELIEDLRPLCKECHYKLHDDYKSGWVNKVFPKNDKTLRRETLYFIRKKNEELKLNPKPVVSGGMVDWYKKELRENQI